ncbi:hypothetical protein GC207_10050 [bacterium]|nr:hypothetical protein [bacterium]
MRALAKSGLLLIAIGTAIYALPVIRFGYPTHVPLRSPFLTDSGAAFRQDFTVRTAQAYSLDLGCRDVAPLDHSQPRIPCDISVRLLKRGAVIQSEHLDVLRPESHSNGTGYWHLAYVHLPSAGQYALEITNRSNLSSLDGTGTVVRMDIGGAFYETALYSKLFGLIIGAPIGSVGFVLFFIGLKRADPAECATTPD